MGSDKEELINAFTTSVKYLQRGIDTHCCLVTSILKQELDDEDLNELLNLCPKRSREIRLEDAIKEAVEVLEESRKAFKSRRLEILRKRLTQVLIDVDSRQ